ncbi:MAG: hypothetical protein HC894_15690 [Microcoleus sp. SM1_3_4]|nr:hypothetical protein [Microcoleus sp. SM1_3_4]
MGHTGSLFGYLLFAVLGFIVLLFGQIESFTFDKNLGYVILKLQQPFRFKNRVFKYQIQDISGVEIQKIDYISYTRRGSRRRIGYRVRLVLYSGKRYISIPSYLSNGLRDKEKTAEIIATFLNIRNYGLRGFSKQQNSSEELQWDTVEEEITHWKTAIRSDSKDANARMKLALALIEQNQIKNKEQAINHLKQAQDIFTTQGYGDEAMQALELINKFDRPN